MCWSQQEQRQKSLNQQIWTYNTAASNKDDVGYLRDSSAASNGNRKNPTEDSRATLKTIQQRIMSRAMMMLGMMSTILMSQFQICVET